MNLNAARIYVGTYAKYNSGSLAGKWVKLSDFSYLEDFMEHCAEIHKDEEEPEYMFQDWEEIPDCLIGEEHLDEDFFELRDELDRLTDTQQDAFWIWMNGDNNSLTRGVYRLVRDFQSDYIGCYDSKEEFAKEILEEREEELSEFARQYFDYEKYANDLFLSDFWYEEGYVFRNS